MTNEIMNVLNKIEYGWVDKNNKIHDEVNEKFSDNYKLQSPEELINSKKGVCWDQVELERYLFNHTNLRFKTFFIVNYDGDKCPTHTFLIYQENKKYYWFEHSWKPFRGIHEYESIKEALTDIRQNFIKFELYYLFEDKNLCIFEYSEPKYGIGVKEFYNHCEKGVNIRF